MKHVSYIFFFLSLMLGNLSATLIIGSGLRNGDFNDDTSGTDSTFGQTDFWENIGTSSNQASNATLLSFDYDGTRSLVVAENPVHTPGQDTGYTIQEGDVFDISYVWRDASTWTDALDQINVVLFTTNDDTIGGTRTQLDNFLSGISTANGSYQTASGTSGAAGASLAGKTLFVGLEGQSGDAIEGWARVDNFELNVTPIPEPATLSIFLLGLALLLRKPFRR